jgi:hypothetical protein
MTHCLLASTHFEDIDGGVGAEDGGVDDVVEGADGWALIHEVEVDGVAVEDLGVKA